MSAAAGTSNKGLSWLGILRLGLVQTALGAIVVLTTSTINRVLVVELALPAMLPGALVGWHYAVQITRPRWGWGSDVGGRRTPWIVGGMAVLALGGLLAALSVYCMASSTVAGIAVAVLAFTLIGVGVGACGTSLLVLLAALVADKRRAAAATITWLMMIAGFIVTTGLAGHFLQPYSAQRLVEIAACVSAIALLITLLAVWNIEPPQAAATALNQQQPPTQSATTSFRQALNQVWQEPNARRFTIFVFVSMLAYSAQDLILEPFAGTVFGLTPGQSTQLAGVQHSGVMVGMLLVALVTTWAGKRRLIQLKPWTIGGCIASAFALISLGLAAITGPGWPLHACVFALGLANGVFAVAAIGSMMNLAAGPNSIQSEHSASHHAGTRMGLWGAAQAIAFGLGGFLGTVASDVAHALLQAPSVAYATVFFAEAALFLVAALLAQKVATAKASAIHQASVSTPLVTNSAAAAQ